MSEALSHSGEADKTARKPFRTLHAPRSQRAAHGGSVDAWLPGHQLEDMRALVRAGESGVALENFCTQLEEHDVVLPSDVAAELREIARLMGMTISL